MATKTKAATKRTIAYDVDYTAAVAGIQKTAKRLIEIKPKVSSGGKTKIEADLKTLAKAAALCRTRMSKTFA